MQVEVVGAIRHDDPQGAPMPADLDLLRTYVFCAADDFLPRPDQNARRMVTDTEILALALALAQSIMGIPSDHRFLAVASKHLIHLFLKASPAPRLLQAPTPAVRSDQGADRSFRAQ